MNKNESKYFNTALLFDEAFLQILEKKDIEFITVKELCAKAGVNRSTFYLHYENVNDLLVETLEMINKRFVSAFGPELSKLAKNSNGTFIRPEFLTPYLNFVKENHRIFKLIHSKPEVFGAEKAFKKMYREVFEPAMKQFNLDKGEATYVFEFFTKGTLAIILKWVSLGCIEPVEKIMDYILKCIPSQN